MYSRPDPHRSPAIRRAAQVLAGGLCLAAAVAVWALITGSFDETSVRVLLTGFAAAVCTVAGLAGAMAVRRGGATRLVGRATIALSELALALMLALIWIPDAAGGEVALRALGVTTALMLAGGHASLLLGRARRCDTNTVRQLRKAAIACATAGALLSSGVFAVSEGNVDSAVWRVLGVLVVLALLATLLIPLARKIAQQLPRSKRRTHFPHGA